ncbi:ABC transporter ATP-binding protein/permease [Allokutzneria sp. A3M-2-11 16]|uniref:ABC transporter ATP-binding protein n=1 Tax=Allokutzneria sp. A3M-2-11 16 TaxID=2962043 RepID=UPI0020B80AD2|nr:ABC transporter ATP-binding protein [Allokutzneria sp. A3M-2-11 16]MCP3804404.1 ABC transporter ATP-binding protein/permease [Allokutzneria sp. A3M-2-11 16]
MNTEETAKPDDFSGSLARLLRMMGPERALLAGVFTAGLGYVALWVTVPLIFGHVTDLIFTGARGPGIDFTAVGTALAWALAAIAGSSGFAWAQGRLTAIVAQRLAFRLRERSADKLNRLPLEYFDRSPRGEVLSRVTNDIDNVSEALQQVLSRVAISLLTLLGVVVMMFWLSPTMALLALVTIPVAIVITRAIAKRAQPHFSTQWATTGKLNGHIEEMYTGHALVKLFGRQREAIATFAEHNEKLYTAAFRAQFVSGITQPAMSFVGNLTYVMVAVVGGLRVASGTMSLGDVQAFIQYVHEFNHPITQLAAMTNIVQSGLASAERVFGLLDAEEQRPEPLRPVPLGTVRGRVTFENVSFRYSPDKPLIEDLSLSVRPGQTVAIVGPTGAGKSTLVNLLMRFYEISEGRITLDGVDIAEAHRSQVRGNIGMVLQDTWLFGGTIAENIAYGVDDVTRERIVEAARATHVDRFVRTLPDGYETVIDEEGSNVSAGEKQLITIARAFLADPAMLVLDEATSSVDTRTEVLLQQAMSSLRQDRTSFVIAHRLSTIRDADVILVMDSGRIVEQGDHHALLAAGGHYARLYAAQFAQPVAA